MKSIYAAIERIEKTLGQEWRADSSWQEAEHPRDKSGKFASSGTYGQNSSEYEKITSYAVQNRKPSVADFTKKYSQKPDVSIEEFQEALTYGGVTITGDKTLYRGMELPKGISINDFFKPGSRLKGRGPQSTSMDEEVAKEFAQLGSVENAIPVMLKIKPGIYGVRGLPIPESGQSEIVLPPDAKMKVLSPPKNVQGLWVIEVGASDK